VSCLKFALNECTSLSLLPADVKIVRSIDESSADVIVVVGPDPPDELEAIFNEMREIDKGFDKVVGLLPPGNMGLPIIYSPLVQVTDYHDVRVYHDAAALAFHRVILGGFQNPLLVVPRCARFSNSDLLSALGALQSLYVVSITNVIVYSYGI